MPRLVKQRASGSAPAEVPHLLDPTYSGQIPTASSSSPPKYSYSKLYVDSQGLKHDPDYKPFAVSPRKRARTTDRSRARSGSRVSQIGLVRTSFDEVDSDEDDEIAEEDGVLDEDDEHNLRESLMKRYGTSSLAALPPHVLASLDRPRMRRGSRGSLYPSTPAQQQHEQKHYHHSRTSSPVAFDYDLTRSGSLRQLAPSPIPPLTASPLRQEFALLEETEKPKSAFSWRNSVTALKPSPTQTSQLTQVGDGEHDVRAKEARSSAFATFSDDVAGNNAQAYVPSKHGQGQRIALPEGESAGNDDHLWTPTCGEAILRQWQSMALSFRFMTFRMKRRIKRRLGLS